LKAALLFSLKKDKFVGLAFEKINSITSRCSKELERYPEFKN